MTVRELIIKLLDYDMNTQVQIAKQGELYGIIDVWQGDIVILEAECWPFPVRLNTENERIRLNP